MVFLVTAASSAAGLLPTSHGGDGTLPAAPIVARRLAAAGLLSSLVTGLRPAVAFDNGVPEMEKYRTRPKNPGTQPPTLGLQRDGKLVRCEYEPNCFRAQV